METFYKKLLEVFDKPEIKAKFTDQNISPVGYIDLYAGQDLDENNFELFTSNTLFIDWDIDHTSKPPIATINLYCGYEQMRDTSNISLNKELGLKFLQYKNTIDEIVSAIETTVSGKPKLLREGFNKMDSIVDFYLFTYECSYTGRKNPLDKYQAGDYDTLDLKGNLNIEFD